MLSERSTRGNCLWHPIGLLSIALGGCGTGGVVLSGSGDNLGQSSVGLVPEIPMTAAESARFEAENAECLSCHENASPTMVQDYRFSQKAKAGVKCESCHSDNPDISVGQEGHRSLPTPETCGACHPNQYQGHRENRHSLSYIRMLECGRFDDFPKEFRVGSGYHFTEEDVAQLSELMDTAGQTEPADAVVMSVQMCGQCHNVENRCDSCHFRHRFSPEEARNPMACATCHMGPDHPQIEMYQHSKHGSRFDVYGDSETVPVCVDCHMPYNDQMLGTRAAADGTRYTDHNLSLGIAYGPIGGGTTRKGQTTDPDTLRVRFVSRDDDATSEEVWLERSDGKIYDAPSDGNVVFKSLYELGTADASGNGKQDYAVHQPADSEATLRSNRLFMEERVCGKCHTRNFAQEQLLIADLIHENTRNVLLEAFDIVKALALSGIGNLTTDDRPSNPETGTTGTYGPNMVIRNLTAIEKMYFTAMKYENVKTWKGAYHQNPDYTHWYGWSALVMTLGEIADEATDKVLQSLWVRGAEYTGVTGGVLNDGLYQGVVFDTGSLANLYDKFPGPGDAGSDEPIDVDMDGIFEFVPLEGSPGTFTHEGTQVEFH
jgi:hydroxylamine dehydrogenase